jgi:hypothetical protein
MSNNSYPGSQPPDDSGSSGGSGESPGSQPSPSGYGPPPGYGAPPSYGAPPGSTGGFPGTYPGQQAPYGPPPAGYLPWAIIAAIAGVFFSLIFGLPVAIFAARSARQVRSRWNSGDADGARKSSRTALTLCLIATVLDALGVILVVVVVSKGGSGTTG